MPLPARGAHVHSSAAVTVPVPADGLCRITSYNVCYTKLLREQGVQLPPLLAASQRQAAVLKPWRALRRRLKTRLETCDYQALLAHELALERWAQEGLLAALLLGKAPSLTDYLTHLGLDQSPLRQPLLALATPSAPE